MFVVSLVREFTIAANFWFHCALSMISCPTSRHHSLPDNATSERGDGAVTRLCLERSKTSLAAVLQLLDG